MEQKTNGGLSWFLFKIRGHFYIAIDPLLTCKSGLRFYIGHREHSESAHGKIRFATNRVGVKKMRFGLPLKKCLSSVKLKI